MASVYARRRRLTSFNGIVYDTVMVRQVVLDTNVFVSALRSRRGASHRLLLLVGGPDFQINLSVPLVIEYEDVAKRMAEEAGLTSADIDDIIDYLCSVARLREIHFLWRPVLKDPGDDHILELAVEAECRVIITHNVRDFVGAERLGITTVTPGEFLKSIGGRS
jgi:putative PIN family toxin of toxin-antitoxin system